MWILDQKSIKSFCVAKNIPYTTFHDWLEADQHRFDRYARAREAAAQVAAEEIIAIADEMAPTLLTGGLDSAFIAQQRLRIDARKWVASKLLPKVYGDKQDVKIEGGVEIRVVTGVPDAITIEQDSH